MFGGEGEGGGGRGGGLNYDVLLNPTLSEQKHFEILTLFRNDVTRIATFIRCWFYFSFNIINVVVWCNVKSIDNVTHHKIFTINKISAIFMFLSFVNLLYIYIYIYKK